MSVSNLKFVIFRDLRDGYRWRLSSPIGQTLERSERGHAIRVSAHRKCFASKTINTLMPRC